jgi:hypothetical protein
MENIKLSSKYVEIGFDEPIEVPTHQNISDLELEARENFKGKTTEDGYILSKVVSLILPLNGDNAGNVLYRPDERYAVWYCFIGSRSFSRLERQANTWLEKFE